MAGPQPSIRVTKHYAGKKSARRRRWWHYALWYAFELVFWLTLIGVVAGGVYGFYIDRDLTTQFEGRRWKLPSHVYSDSLSVIPETSLASTGVIDRLKRLNYQEVENEPVQAGEFRRTAGALEIYLRRFEYPAETAQPRKVRLTLNGEMVTHIFDQTNKKELYVLDVEPELIGRFFGQVQEERRIIPWKDIPKSLVWSVVAMEDAAFFDHLGLNIKGLSRAAIKAAFRMSIREGGSSITQQLVKNFYLSPERTLSRKLREMVMAIVLEMHYPKDKIFEVYINQIYFGQSGSVAICGLGEAAQFYFGKKAEDLTLAESALLAGLIRSPAGYDPRRHEQRAKVRRDYILTRLAKMPLALAELHVRAADLEAAKKQELAVHRHLPPRTIAPYFIDLLRQQLTGTYGDEVLQSEGLRIFTTLDPLAQRLCEDAVTRTMEELEKTYPKLQVADANKLQAAIVVTEPSTGYVRAMVGGREYANSTYNRAVQMKRQVGSVFKPFVFTAGFLRAHEDKDFDFTGASIVKDEPFSIPSGGRNWSPNNYDKKFEGDITARRALEMSRNVPTARLALKVGIENVIRTARLMGVTADLPPYPALSLGIAELSPLEAAAAFGALASQGYYNELLTIRDVVDQKGKVLEKRSIKPRRVLPSQVAYLTTHLMEGVVERGTAAGVRRMGINLPVAGKTGTTNDMTDAWFVGFTPSILAVTWVGFDHDRQVGLAGATAAMPVWGRFMAEYLRGQTPRPFDPPPGIVFRKICQATGLLAVYNCPVTVDEAFEEGREPTHDCGLHKDRVLEFFKNKEH